MQYDALYWGAVFPLGMCAAGTWQMDIAMGFGFFGIIARAFFYLALLAWAVTFAGLVLKLWRVALRRWSGLKPS